MQDITLPVAFAAGILSFISPCVLPIVPVYLSNLAGVSAIAYRPGRWHIFLHALTFVIGFSVAFAALGASVGLLGSVISVLLLRRITGVLLVLFGLFLIASHKIPRLNYEVRLTSSFSKTTGYLQSFLLGLTFSLAWTPCVGPILGGILSLASSSQTAWQGAYLLLIYSLGLGLPFIAAGLAIGIMTPLIKWLNRNGNIISVLSGLLLILIGILMLINAPIIRITNI